MIRMAGSNYAEQLLEKLAKSQMDLEFLIFYCPLEIRKTLKSLYLFIVDYEQTEISRSLKLFFATMQGRGV